MRRWLFNYLWSRHGAGGAGDNLEAAKMKLTLKPNTRYRATITLTTGEAWFATNDYIAEEFRKLGFIEAKVTGDGTKRKGEALWPGPEKTIDDPPHPRLTGITEVV